MEKANVTLYTVIGDSNRIVEAIRERFKEMTKEFVCEDETIDLTLPDGTHVIFSIKHRMSKPDFIASHISGMANYFSQVKTPGWTKRKCLAPDTCVQLCDWDHFRSERQ